MFFDAHDEHTHVPHVDVISQSPREENEKKMEEVKKRAEMEQMSKLKEAEEKSRKMEAERIAAKNEDDSDDDLDDLLDDICIHPSHLKKPEPEVTEDDARRASEKFAKAKGEEEKEKRTKEKWFTNSDKGENGEGGEEEEEDDGKFSFYKVPSFSILILILQDALTLISHFLSSFYKVPWHCNTCGMNVAGDQVNQQFRQTNVFKFS